MLDLLAQMLVFSLDVMIVLFDGDADHLFKLIQLLFKFSFLITKLDYLVLFGLDYLIFRI